MSASDEILHNYTLNMAKDHGPSSYKDDKMPGTYMAETDEDQIVEDMLNAVVKKVRNQTLEDHKEFGDMWNNPVKNTDPKEIFTPKFVSIHNEDAKFYPVSTGDLVEIPNPEDPNESYKGVLLDILKPNPAWILDQNDQMSAPSSLPEDIKKAMNESSGRSDKHDIYWELNDDQRTDKMTSDSLFVVLANSKVYNFRSNKIRKVGATKLVNEEAKIEQPSEMSFHGMMDAMGITG